MSKMYGTYLKELIEEDWRTAREEGRAPRPEEEFEAPAAIKVLKTLRKQSLKRSKKHHLTQTLQLREIQVSCGEKDFEYTEKVLATLPAKEEKP
jgi:hypothetical protein